MTEKTSKKFYPRFSATQRMEHMILLLAFIGLGLTGFLQKYSYEELAHTLIKQLGGIESIRIMHRAFAVLLMLEALYHALVVSYNLYVRGLPASLRPHRKDWEDFRDWVRFNLHLKAERPNMPYFNFGQKWDYWMTVIGGSILILTGIMMWNPIAVTSILPGKLLPAAQTIHSGQALLLVANIFVWHLYSAWFKHLNFSILRGKMSHKQMTEAHGEYLANPPQEPEFSQTKIAEKRQRYLPIALVVSLVLIGGSYLFLSYEDTALDTVPRQSALIYAPNFQIEEGNIDVGAAIWQSERCSYCHGKDAQTPLNETVPIVYGTDISFEIFYQQVRVGKNDMPSFSREEIPDRYLMHMYAWLTMGTLDDVSGMNTEGSNEDKATNDAPFG